MMMIMMDMFLEFKRQDLILNRDDKKFKMIKSFVKGKKGFTHM
jgi:hypothetical protein